MRGARPTLAALTGLTTLVLVTCGGFAPSVMAYHSGIVKDLGLPVRDTVALGAQYWIAYRASLQQRDRVDFVITVMSGTEIDLYIIPDSRSGEYRGHSLFFSSYGEVERFRTIQGNFTALNSGAVLFVIDNVDFSGAQPTGNVTVDVLLEKARSPPFPAIVVAVCSVGIVGAVAVGLTIAIRNRRKRARAMAAQVGSPPGPAQTLSPPPSPVESQWPPPPPPPEE